MNRVFYWTLINGVIAGVGRAYAAAPTAIFTELSDPIINFVDFLYLCGVAGVVIGGIWAAAKWYQTREMSEGFWGMLTVTISGIWIFFIVPKLTAVVPKFGG